MGTPPLWVSVNGQLVAAEAPAVTALDRGLLYGDGLFETIRAYEGIPFLLDAHLERLAASAAALRIADRLDTAAVAGNVGALLAANHLDGDAYIRITLTRGIHTGSLALEPAAAPTLTIVAKPLHPPSPDRYERGIAAVVASVRRNAESPLPGHKTLNYLGSLLARTEATDAGADDAILLNTHGEVAEAASSNLFVVRGGRVATPPLDAGILPGITRREVLRLAAEAGIRADERRVSPEELRGADEVFLTNAVVELLPVCSIDGQPVGGGSPGPLTRRLHAAYRGRVEATLASARRR